MAAYSYYRLLFQKGNGSGYVCAAEIELHTSIGGADICTGGTASVSGASEGTAADIFDNSTSSYWVCGEGSSGAWAQYQLSSAAEVVEYCVTTRPSYLDDSPKEWLLLGSNNGTDWVIVDRKVGQVSWSSSEKRTFTPDYVAATTGQYFAYKLASSANNGSSNTAFSEFELFETSGGSDLTTTGCSATDSGNWGGQTAACLIDDNINTMWNVAASTGWIKIALPQPKGLDHYTVRSRNDSYLTDTPKDWILYGLDEYNNETEVDAQTNQTGWSAGEVRTYSTAVPAVFAMPATSVAPTFATPSLAGVQVGSFTLPTTTVAPTFAAPLLSTSQPGVFNQPVSTVTPSFTVPSLTGIRAGVFAIPTTATTPTFAVPGLVGFTEAGFTLPSIDAAPGVTAPALTGVQQGVFTQPADVVSPTFAVPALNGVMAGTFTVPGISNAAAVVAPDLAGIEVGVFDSLPNQIAPGFATPSLTGVQVGSFIFADIAGAVTANPPELAGLEKGWFFLPPQSSKPNYAVASLTGEMEGFFDMPWFNPLPHIEPVALTVPPLSTMQGLVFPEETAGYSFAAEVAGQVFPPENLAKVVPEDIKGYTFPPETEGRTLPRS